jgi:hypothetical protein
MEWCLKNCFGQVLESGDDHFQPSKIAKKVHKSTVEPIQLYPKLKSNMACIKATKGVQRAIMQVSQLLMKFYGNMQYHDQGSDVWREHPPHHY